MWNLASLEERIGAPDKLSACVGGKAVVADRADPLKIFFCHTQYGLAA